MVEAKKNLLDRFYQEFWVFLLLFILMVIITSALITFYFVKFRKMKIQLKIGVLIVVLILVGLSFLMGVFYSKYHNDYLYLKTGCPLQITGKVIGYSNITAGDDLTVTKSWPIIQTDGIVENISLNVIKSEEKLQLNEMYEFLYLPNTRIAEVVINK